MPTDSNISWEQHTHRALKRSQNVRLTKKISRKFHRAPVLFQDKTIAFSYISNTKYSDDILVKKIHSLQLLGDKIEPSQIAQSDTQIERNLTANSNSNSKTLDNIMEGV